MSRVTVIEELYSSKRDVVEGREVKLFLELKEVEEGKDDNFFFGLGIQFIEHVL